MTLSTNFQYVALADEIESGIMKGRFEPGEKLPSLRKLHLQMGLSVSTVHQAYIELEKRGRVEAKEKSGFYVRTLNRNPMKQPPLLKIKAEPCRVMVNDLAKTIIRDLQSDDILMLGAAVPSKELMPLKQLSRIMKSMPADSLQHHMSNYDLCAGNADLRDALSKRMPGSVFSLSADDIITTSGCLDAVSLCLRSVAGPGDAVLVESPAFHCFLQLIEDLNMYVVEVPGCPETGISPETFQETLSSHKIKICLLNSNFQNPLGSVMSSENKAKILAIAEAYGVPIIEDDIYGDLFYGDKRPATFKAWIKLASFSIVHHFQKLLHRAFGPDGPFRENIRMQCFG